jgi:hypothetical protein
MKLTVVSPMGARCRSAGVVGCASLARARGLTPTSRGAAPTGLDQLSMLTQRLRAGLSYVAAPRLECGALDDLSNESPLGIGAGGLPELESGGELAGGFSTWSLVGGVGE